MSIKTLERMSCTPKFLLYYISFFVFSQRSVVDVRVL